MSLQIREIVAEYTALIEPLSLDEAYLDVMENLKGQQIATEIAREIRAKIRQVTGLNASAGRSDVALFGNDEKFKRYANRVGAMG